MAHVPPPYRPTHRSASRGPLTVLAIIAAVLGVLCFYSSVLILLFGLLLWVLVAILFIFLLEPPPDIHNFLFPSSFGFFLCAIFFIGVSIMLFLHIHRLSQRRQAEHILAEADSFKRNGSSSDAAPEGGRPTVAGAEEEETTRRVDG